MHAVASGPCGDGTIDVPGVVPLNLLVPLEQAEVLVVGDGALGYDVVAADAPDALFAAVEEHDVAVD